MDKGIILFTRLCWKGKASLVTMLRKLEYTKEGIRICKSKKNRQHNGRQKDKGTKNHLQNTTNKTKDQAKQTRLKTGDELRSSVRIISYCFTSATCHVAPVTNLVISHKFAFERIDYRNDLLKFRTVGLSDITWYTVDKGNNKITVLRTILQRESQNS